MFKTRNARTHIAMWSCTIGTVSVLVGPAIAEEPVLELHSVGLYDWPVNAKDAKVVSAFKLLRDRIGDLADEMGMEPEQAQMMEMGWDLLTARSALRFAPTENGIDASFVLAPEHGNLESMQQQLGMLAMMGGMEFVDQGNGIAQAMGPVGPMNLGFDDDRIWLTLGDSQPATLDVSGKGLPAGTTPIMSGRVDINAMIQMFAPELAMEIEQQSDMLLGSGAAMFVGPNASVLEFGMGIDTHSMHMFSRMIGARAAMEAMGNTDQALITRDDLRAIPMDAVQLSVMPTNIQGTLEGLQMALEMSGEENPLEALEAEIGVDIMNDVLMNIGDRAYYYQSESTGGGGLSSMVLMLELRDPDAMAEAHGTLVERLNELATEQIKGYARVHAWDVHGVTGFSMTAPGLPIPFEPSWAISGNNLVFALTPMALSESLAQLSGKRDSSIIDHPGFRSVVLDRMPDAGAVSVYFTDSPRMAAKGYGMTNLLTSAIANAARSPEHPDRVEGSLMPSYHEFVADIAPMGGISMWEGDDLVSRYSADRSVLVQLASGLGTIADVQGVMLPALAAGVTLPALGKARETAKQVKSQTQLRSIVQAMVIYGAEHDGKAPSSFQDLIDAGYISWDLLESPLGPAYDGGPDFTVRFTQDAVSSYDARYIVAIDRAMLYETGWKANVGFADAHVEVVDYDQLLELLNLPQNKGAAEALQIDDF